MLTIVSAQMDFLLGDIEGNANRIITYTQEAYKKSHADLVVFPELTLTGYPPEDLLFRPKLYQRMANALDKVCQSVKDTAIIIGYPTQINDLRYNMAALIQNGKITATYAKQALPNYTVFDEKRYFTPGHKACTFHIKNTCIGLIICEDLWEQEPIEKAVAAGAQIVVSINASPFALQRAEQRQKLLHDRSQQHQIPIIYTNTVGAQDELVFDGGSMVYDQNGQCCQQADFFKEQLLVTQFDNARIANANPNELQHKQQTMEEKIYQTLVLGVRDYIEKNNFPGAIIGLSGGIDSGLTLAIACDAIGADRVEAVMMPSKYTSEISLADAKQEAELLGCKYSVIAIDAIAQAFESALSDEFKHYAKDSTEENLQARARGTLLMAISNKKGSIVLTTGNKSELAVGYATLYGDMAGGFCVLKDVYKTMVYRLSKYRNSISSVIPQRVIDRAPSAELAPNQTDQDTLPPYPELDDILERFIHREQGLETIVKAGFDQTTVKKVIKMVVGNEYKRRQAPIGIRLAEKAFGKDRRYPITTGYF